MQMSSLRRGFTLIELLVVIAIIAILAAILFPVFAQAKAAAKQTANLNQMKQLAIGAQIYAADYDDSIMQDPPAGTNFCPSGGSGSIDRWGNYYWPWLMEPYIKQKARSTSGPKGFYWSPQAPDANPSELSGTRASCIWPEPATSWGLTCAVGSGSNCTAIRYWSSYAYNEHIGDWQGSGAGNLTAWDNIAEAFFLLEGTDSEIEGDELDELYSRTETCANYPDPANRDATRGGHNLGTTIAYLDGHAKWRRTTWGANGQCTLDVRNNPRVEFPPSTRGGDNVRVKGWTPISEPEVRYP
jgi:prepilin-type N-terminal cleavage/methylation domain-containing protein/prepilin-type processing-associated H-X9-DG protein